MLPHPPMWKHQGVGGYLHAEGVRLARSRSSLRGNPHIGDIVDRNLRELVEKKIKHQPRRIRSPGTSVSS